MIKTGDAEQINLAAEMGKNLPSVKKPNQITKIQHSPETKNQTHGGVLKEPVCRNKPESS